MEFPDILRQCFYIILNIAGLFRDFVSASLNLNFIKYHDGIIVGFYFLSIERNILFLALFQMRRLV